MQVTKAEKVVMGLIVVMIFGTAVLVHTLVNSPMIQQMDRIIEKKMNQVEHNLDKERENGTSIQ